MDAILHLVFAVIEENIDLVNGVRIVSVRQLKLKSDAYPYPKYLKKIIIP